MPPPEMRKLDVEAIRQAARAIELQEIVLVEMTWAARPFDPQAKKLNFDFVVPSVEWESDKESLAVWLRYEVRGTAATLDQTEGAGEEALRSSFALHSTWVVRYAVTQPIEAEGEAMGDFAYANGQLNSFPYLRQQVQDLTTKAGWPPLVLPVFRAPSSRPEGIAKPRNAGHRPSERPAALTDE